MTIAQFIAKYNDSGSGLFKDNVTRDISEQDLRDMVTDITTLTDIPISQGDYPVTSSSSTSGSVANENRFHYYTGTAAATRTLPAPSGTGKTLIFAHIGGGANSLVVTAAASGQIYSGGAVDSVPVFDGEVYKFHDQGTYWVQIT